MISRIEALNYKCLRDVSQSLSGFNILVGPNASGKTTFLEVVSFLGDLVSEGLEAAIFNRTNNFNDLTWKGTGEPFELAVEFKIPEDKKELLEDKEEFEYIRYEVRIGMDEETEEISILNETGLFIVKEAHEKNSPRSAQRSLFPMGSAPRETLLSNINAPDNKTVFNKKYKGNDNYYGENYGKQKGYKPSFKLGPKKSTLANLPEDETKFPVATWLKYTLASRVNTISLNSLGMRKASPPGLYKGFRPDGSNLPWVIEKLKKESPADFQDWLSHLQTSLPDLEDIETIERPEDRHKYLKTIHAEGFKVPSWMVSDGTLRLMALTLMAYIPDFQGVYLIEEPENGIHPQAIQTIYDSLSTVYDAQILLATHSPVFLSLAKPEEILCFARTEHGATDIVSGDEHPRLKDWKGTPNISELFASGVLG
ncbi:MAG: ATP-binding protein [bacterium]